MKLVITNLSLKDALSISSRNVTVLLALRMEWFETNHGWPEIVRRVVVGIAQVWPSVFLEGFMSR